MSPWPSTSASRPVLLRSFLLERGRDRRVPHAFTTRLGGVSRVPFDALNFGNPGDLPTDQRDPMTNIAANRAAMLGSIGLPDRELVEVWQVHGGHVHVVRAGRPTHETAHDTKADAIVTDDPRRVLGVRVADCAPVLLASGDGGVVAAVHAGWRGVIADILPNTLRAMRELGGADIRAAIGPCISASAFEVGDEVAEAFETHLGANTPAVRRPGDTQAKPRVDIKLALVHQLIAAGVERSGIEVLPHCTFTQPGLFFSHRRDALRSGRMLAVIGAV